MSPEIYHFFASFIEKELGINFSNHNLYQLQIRIEEIAQQENIPVIELEKMFKAGAPLELKIKLLDHATNNETLFFRDPPYFNAIIEFMLKVVLPMKPSHIKIWSAACSFGQEPISLAICLEELSQKMKLPEYSIEATDISSKALEKARSGIYSDFEVMRGLSEERLKKYFSKVKDGWKISPQISHKIHYQLNNLTTSKIQGPFDLILCRNVLIYQKVELKKNVVHSLMHELAPHGALLLGVGESLLGILENPQIFNIEKVLFYQAGRDLKFKNAI